jgi:hypothetical protein
MNSRQHQSVLLLRWWWREKSCKAIRTWQATQHKRTCVTPLQINFIRLEIVYSQQHTYTHSSAFKFCSQPCRREHSPHYPYVKEKLNVHMSLVELKTVATICYVTCRSWSLYAENGTRWMPTNKDKGKNYFWFFFYFNARTVHLYMFLFQPTNAQTCHKTISLYNVHSYMFLHLYVIFREFQKVVYR